MFVAIALLFDLKGRMKNLSRFLLDSRSLGWALKSCPDAILAVLVINYKRLLKNFRTQPGCGWGRMRSRVAKFLTNRTTCPFFRKALRNCAYYAQFTYDSIRKIYGERSATFSAKRWHHESTLCVHRFFFSPAFRLSTPPPRKRSHSLQSIPTTVHWPP